MTTRTFTGKGGETWEWDETPEVLQALKNCIVLPEQLLTPNYANPTNTTQNNERQIHNS